MKKLFILLGLLLGVTAKATSPVIWGPSSSAQFLSKSAMLPQTSTPAPNPPAGNDFLYFKSDNNLYSLTPGGVETLISAGSASGTVTSVGLALPANVFSISGSPVINSGTLTGSFISQTANMVFAAPNGSSGVPTFRLLVAADLPTGNFTDAGTDGITVTGGSNSVIGSGTSLSQHVADTSHNGYLASVDWNTFNGKQAALSFGNLTDVGTDGITVTGGTGAVIGSGTSLAQHVADTSHSGYLASADWNTFNGKQPAGNYITALTGGVTATGPGSAVATVAQTLTDRYVDLIGGNDSNDGSSLGRWKTMAHACSVVSSLTTFNEPYTIHISGGTGNDTDSGTVNCPPNVAYVADQLTQLTGNWVISASVNDSITFTNLIFLGSVSWLRNDIYSVTLNANNTVFGGGLNFKQSGSGASSIQANNSTFVGMDVKLMTFGSFFFDCQITAAATFEDANADAYYQFMSGYIGAPISFAGGPYVYMAGVVADVPFGYTLTTSSTSNGSPTLQVDSGSVPPTISGPNTLYLASFSQNTSYTPAVSGNWSPAPSQVASALDQLAARPNGASSLTMLVTAKSSNYTILSSDNGAFPVDATSGNIQITLPTAASVYSSGASRVYTVKKIDSSIHTVTIATVGGDTLDGGTTQILEGQFQSITFYSTGGTWYVQ